MVDVLEIPVVKTVMLAEKALMKAKAGIEKNKPAEACSNKYIILAKRMFDTCKTFLISFEKTLDLAIADAMLLLARSCLLNAHVLQHHFKLEERALDITLMTKLRKDAGKIVQRTMGRGKKQDPFIYKEEDYAKQGIGVVVNLESNKRKYYDELNNTSIALKTLGNKLIRRIEQSELFKLGKGPYTAQGLDDEASTELLQLSVDDVGTAYKVVVTYYEQIQHIVGRDEAVMSMFETLPKPGVKLRSDTIKESKRKANRVVDALGTLQDVHKASKMIEYIPPLKGFVRNRGEPQPVKV